MIIKAGLKSVKKCNFYLEQFNRHFTATTDRAENILELKRKESYWQHMFSTFIPNGLNERFVGIPTL